MTLEQFKKKKLPEGPGVYFFLGKRKQILYIGKATSLISRVRSYFAPDLIEGRGQRIVNMVEEASALEWRETDSVLEALILEANLIKTHKPRYNILEKDDKSFNYVVITKEAFPRVLLVRGKDLPHEWPAKTRLKAFGPFPHGSQLIEALKLIRRIFPYRDSSCIPCGEQGNVSCKPCFNAQIGLCPGPCAGWVTKEEYRRSIRHLSLFFEGKKKALRKELEREMKAYAKEEKFEEAGERRKQLFALDHINDVALIKEEYKTPQGLSPFRVEAYDVAHLMGGAMVGVMTVVENGAKQPAQYRKFNIKTVNGANDPAALAEVLSRRLGHDEWPMPRLIVVDGSTAQMNAAEKVLNGAGVRIPIVGVVKDEKHRPKHIKGDRMIITSREKDILLANMEAHRYAIAFHRQKKRRELF
jgi:excinuclease ABC subunit C